MLTSNTLSNCRKGSCSRTEKDWGFVICQNTVTKWHVRRSHLNIRFRTKTIFLNVALEACHIWAQWCSSPWACSVAQQMKHSPTQGWWDVMGSKLAWELVILLCLKIMSDITTITPSDQFEVAFETGWVSCFEGGMGPLQLNSHTVQKHLSGGQMTKWVADKKGSYLPNGKISLFFLPNCVSRCPLFFCPAWPFSSKGVILTQSPTQPYKSQ